MVRSTFALAAVLSVASTGLAGDLVTPPLLVGASSVAACRIMNITSATIPAQFQMIRADGTVLWDSGPTMLVADQVIEIRVSGPATVFCRFVKASKSKIRGAVTRISGGDNITVVAAQ